MIEIINLFESFFYQKQIKYRMLAKNSDCFVFTIEVNARPGSKRERVERCNDGSLKIHVNARAIDGEANIAIIKFVADLFNVSAGSVELVSGIKGKNKIIAITIFKKHGRNLEYFEKILNSVL